MAGVLRFLAEHGAMLLAGVTALLGLGCAGAATCRSPVHRQRICELSLVAAVGWAVLACIPLPRVGWGAPETTALIAAAPVRVVEVREIPAELIAKPKAAERVRGDATPGAGELAARQCVDWRGWAVVAFLTGAVVCAAWLVLGYVLLSRVIRRSLPAPEAVGQVVDGWVGAGRVRVRVSSEVAGPVTCGVWRPVILLPEGLLEADRAGQLRQVLLHEAGHVRQRDAWGGLLFCLGLPALYFHPCYWWLRRSAELARELVVDDWAARRDGKAAYVGELVALARSRAGGARVAVGAIGMIRRRSHFYRRMRMLLQRSEPLATGCSGLSRTIIGVIGAAAVLGAVAVLGVRPARAQERAAEQPAEVQAARGREDERRVLEKRLAALPEEVADLQAALAKEKAATASDALDPNQKRDLTMEEKMRAKRAWELKRADAEAAQTSAAAQSYKRQAARQDTPGMPNPAVLAGAAVGGVQLDLVNLANTLVDASGAVKLAKINFESRERLNKASGGASDLEVAEARARLETAEKRLVLLRSIAQVATESAQAHLNRVQQLHKQGVESNQSLEEAMGKVKMLELIVRGAE